MLIKKKKNRNKCKFANKVSMERRGVWYEENLKHEVLSWSEESGSARTEVRRTVGSSWDEEKEKPHEGGAGASLALLLPLLDSACRPQVVSIACSFRERTAERATGGRRREGRTGELARKKSGGRQVERGAPMARPPGVAAASTGSGGAGCSPQRCLFLSSPLRAEHAPALSPLPRLLKKRIIEYTFESGLEL